MTFRILTIVHVAAVIALCPTLHPAAVNADDRVTIELQDGRTFTGRIDSRTGEERLWLRFGSESISVLRPIAWETVAAAHYDGESIDAGRLRRVAEQLKANPFGDEQAEAAIPAMDPAIDTPGISAQDPTHAQVAQTALGFSPRVAAVDFDVYAANWDADVETDGLVLEVFPTDGEGRVVPARGTLHVELLGRPRRERNSPSHPGQPLRTLGKWTRSVTLGDGKSFQLPFQAVQPEFQPGVGAIGLVHVRLAVPGHGVFNASYDGVRIRPYSPIRDALQAESGKRFLPQERTGRN
ncbi:MAG: hypothetical protein RIC55_22855 [Pirellulaceae bacterium]